MTKPKIHYRHPKFSTQYHACGMGKPLPENITVNIDLVTCQRCLGTIAGRNSGRQIGESPKVQKTIRLDAGLNDRLRALAASTGREQIEILETALSRYLA